MPKRSPSGRPTATAWRNGTARLWRAVAGAEAAVLLRS
jgi:hypothetical protein